MLSTVIGLGNVGADYKHTRHNVGFAVLVRVAAVLKAESRPETPDYRWAVARSRLQPVTLAWPTTLMNRSGRAAARLVEEHQLAPEQMLVVVDDFNLPLGRLRMRHRGSDGGHNGLASLIDHLGTEDFPRLRLGIGPVPDDMEVTDFVLGRFTEPEIETADRMITSAAEAVLFALEHGLDEAMTRYNVNPAQS
jgi:PTH1 family peptidyl-tRNA hydrolase